jgi:DNA phosphorothioation-associated putative methyltransferase
MDFKAYKELISRINIGKELPDSVYVHNSALSSVPEKLALITFKVADALKISDDDWNIAKYNKRDFKLSLLHYPEFEGYAYPALQKSFTIDLEKFSVRESSYEKSDNPPILHRKETFVSEDHEMYEEFCDITAEGEKIDLYSNPRSIGFKKNWERLISRKGYRLDEYGRIHPKSNSTADNKVHLSDTDENIEIDRHKTAIERNQLSAPMQILAKHGYLDGDYSILDYGCGKGDDITELEAHGIDCVGWDPIHRPDSDLIISDIVNLGFVLNVIEDREERDKTLKKAWELADRLLIISVMVAGESVIRQFTPYRDGVITSIKTFQKYYAQSEIRSYIETTLNESSVASGQGIFIVFKDKIEEQNFLLERQHIRRDWRQLTERIRQSKPKSLSTEIIEKNKELFDDFWSTTLDLGRIPANSEFEHSSQVRQLAGSHNKAAEVLIGIYGEEIFTKAKSARREDLLVYFALSLFEKRKAYSQMPDSLKRDVKAFFESISQAYDEAKEMLFSVGNPSVIEENCIKAYEQIKYGELTTGHSFTFHKDYLNELPARLRIYIGCALQLYGEIEGMHLIKAHMTSGKVSLMRYDDWEKDEPLLVERIKIKLREQDIDFFEYGDEFEPTPLFNRKYYL